MLAKGDKSLKQSRLPTELFPIKKTECISSGFCDSSDHISEIIVCSTK